MGRIRSLPFARRLKTQNGFTLLELVFVLSICSMLLAVALPALQKPLAHYRLRSTAVQLAADLRWLRQQSIYGKAVMVNWQIAPQEGFYLLREGTKVVLRRDLPPGVKITQVVLNRNSLYFTLTGAPETGGRIVLENSFGETCTVFIMPASGRIRVECESKK